MTGVRKILPVSIVMPLCEQQIRVKEGTLCRTRVSPAYLKFVDKWD